MIHSISLHPSNLMLQVATAKTLHTAAAPCPRHYHVISKDSLALLMKMHSSVPGSISRGLRLHDSKRNMAPAALLTTTPLGRHTPFRLHAYETTARHHHNGAVSVRCSEELAEEVSAGSRDKVRL